MNHTIPIAILVEDKNLYHQAMQLAESLNLPIFEDPIPLDYQLILCFFDGIIALKENKNKGSLVYVDFSSPQLLYRANHASLKKEMLAKAIGIHPKDQPIIVDATAGFGRDSFILAHLGYDIILLEKSLIIFKLLENGLQRASNLGNLAETITRMHLNHAEAIQWLNKRKMDKNRPDVVYLDPMYPLRKKAAKVKKEMVILHNLLGIEQNLQPLFDAAITCAKDRVVVKRPRNAQIISRQVPSYALIGKTSRFDIYLVT